MRLRITGAPSTRVSRIDHFTSPETHLFPGYALCQTGTKQSPIPLFVTAGLSLVHKPTFSNGYKVVNGSYYNWGYGPAQSFTPSSDHDSSASAAVFDFKTLPSMQFDNETVYLRGWHIHAPADHTVNGVRAKAELHLVHSDSNGKARAVVAIRLDPGNTNGTWFSQLPRPLIGFNELATEQSLTIDMSLALGAVNNLSE